jgi:hypothetical protein
VNACELKNQISPSVRRFRFYSVSRGECKENVEISEGKIVQQTRIMENQIFALQNISLFCFSQALEDCVGEERRGKGKERDGKMFFWPEGPSK